MASISTPPQQSFVPPVDNAPLPQPGADVVQDRNEAEMPRPSNPQTFFRGGLFALGVPGAILAVPMLAILKIICDRLRPLKALGHFLQG